MAQFAHVVVVIPGILGTTLTKDGKNIWDLNLLPIVGAAWNGGGAQALALTEPDSQDEDLGDGVVAAHLVSSIEAVPGFWKLGGYSRMMEALRGVPGLTEGKNLFAFPYDWRRDNRVSARRLKKQTADWLATWQQSSGNANARLVLIAHSMGGLVASYFLNCLEGWRDVHTVIDMGVPYRGSAKALDFLANGFFGISGLAGKESFASMDSVYQLLPTYKFVEADGALYRPHEILVAGVDASRAKTAWEFHEELTVARNKNAALDGYDRVIIKPVVGVKQTTGQSAQLNGTKLKIANSEAAGGDHSGDGTVPRVSTTPVDGNDAATMFVANQHAALAGDAIVLDHICAILGGTTIDMSQYRASTLSKVLSLHLPEIAIAGEAIRISAVASEHHQFLNADIADANGKTVRQVRMFPTDGAHAAETTLPAGLYWVNVSGQRAHTVGDVLVVLPESAT